MTARRTGPSNPLHVVLATVSKALGSERRGWALVGGLAVGTRAEPRMTRDVDLAVSVEDDAEAERLVHRLASSGFRVVATLEHDRTGRPATVRLLPPGEPAPR